MHAQVSEDSIVDEDMHSTIISDKLKMSPYSPMHMYSCANASLEDSNDPDLLCRAPVPIPLSRTLITLLRTSGARSPSSGLRDDLQWADVLGTFENCLPVHLLETFSGKICEVHNAGDPTMCRPWNKETLESFESIADSLGHCLHH